jgi:hypothetical protein
MSPATIKRRQVFMQNAGYCSTILTKSGISQQVFIKMSNINFDGNPSGNSGADTREQTDRQRDR